MRKSVSAGWVEKLVESWLRFQNNYRHSVVGYLSKNGKRCTMKIEKTWGIKAFYFH